MEKSKPKKGASVSKESTLPNQRSVRYNVIYHSFEIDIIKIKQIILISWGRVKCFNNTSLISVRKR